MMSASALPNWPRIRLGTSLLLVALAALLCALGVERRQRRLVEAERTALRATLDAALAREESLRLKADVSQALGDYYRDLRVLERSRSLRAAEVGLPEWDLAPGPSASPGSPWRPM